MKRFCLSILLTMLMSMMGTNAFAYDIEVKNADGVTIYYNFINDGTELAVTAKVRGSSGNSNAYQGDVVIPEEVTVEGKTNKVTTIGEYAFYSCSKLTSIIIPNSVTTIEGYAFSGCKDLVSVTIPNSVTSIDYNVFWGCTSLTSIEIPNSMTSIPGSMFSGCTSLTSVIIPNSVTSIKSYAFNNCI